MEAFCGVYVATSGVGTAHALPHFAISLIRHLGAERAERDIAPVSELDEGLNLGGHGVKMSSRRAAGWDSMTRYFARQPNLNWKHYRRTQFYTITGRRRDAKG